MDRAAFDALPRLAHADTDWPRARRSTYLVHQSFRYEYPSPICDLRQRLQVIPPRRHGDQRTLGWGLEVSRESRRRVGEDEFGNTVVCVEVDSVETDIGFDAWSVLERRADARRCWLPGNDAWTLATPLTTADAALADAAEEVACAGAGGLALGERVCDWVYRHMVYRHDVTSIHTTAARAYELGAGVCQDYAHIALALCRRAGLPARYVSGHLLGEGGTHAWIEVMLADVDRPSRWHAVALDPTHNRRAGLTYLTVATGRDYRDVAPTSGSYWAPVCGLLSVRKQAALVAVSYRDE